MRGGSRFILVLSALLLGVAVAEDAQTPAGAYKHWLTDLPPPLSGVTAQQWFPDHPGQRFVAGGLVDVVVGFESSAGEAFNITGIAGSINAPQAFQYYVQNFTYQPYNAYLQPGQQVSLQYTFQPATQVPIQEWQLALTAYFVTRTGYYSNTFFNQTIDVIDKPRLIDTQLLFLFVIAAGVISVGVFLAWDYISQLNIYKKVQKRSRKSPAKRPQAVPVTAQPPSSNEWLKGTHYGQEQRQRVPAKRQSSRKLPTSPPQATTVS